jgi:hypothetical protein
MHNFENKEEAQAQNHELVEIESTGVSLGSKYYESNQKPVLSEAEDTNAPSIKQESASIVSVSSERKTEEKVENKKVEKKEKVEIKSNTGMFL